MPSHHYIACDLGAESGRVVFATLEAGHVRIEEIHRFPNLPVRLTGSLRWDLLRLFAEIKTGLRLIAQRGVTGASVSVDSWGVDYAWYNAVHPLLAPAYHYRDARTDSTYQHVRTKLGDEAIFAETGIQFMPINTLYQLQADLENSPDLLAAADGFLMVGDHLNCLLSGVACVEESNASNTQLYNPRTHSWSESLIRQSHFPARLFPKIVPSGTVLGPLLDHVAQETMLAAAQVIATCSHDTGAAVAAVPAEPGDDWAYLSSGTWSLLGVELPGPIINETVRAHNFTNEAGYGGTTRFLKNIVGLWLLQECRAEWMRLGDDVDYGTLNEAAAAVPAFRSLIRPEAAVFSRAGDMPQKIVAFCRATRQPEPATPGQFARCILESLSLLYRITLAEIETLTGRQIHRLHIVGGGSQSALLNQFAANATGREVVAGPVEATAIGNALIQALTLAHLSSLEDLRATVRASFPLVTFQPREPSAWLDAYHRFTRLPLAL